MQSHLRFQRERRGWSRAALAEALGTTTDIVTGWEEGLAMPPPQFQEKLRSLLGLSERSLTLDGMAGGTSASEGLAFLLIPNSPAPALQPPEPDNTRAVQTTTTAVYDALLPPPFLGSNRLIGRTALFEQLKQQLFMQQSLALYGLPGVGKTALAVALAHDPEVQAYFYDGVLWAGLGLSPHVPGVLTRWGTLLGVPTFDEETRGRQEAWMQAFHAAIAQRHLLLVLDDVWQVEVLEALRPVNSRCALVLTTRFAHIATHLADERAMQVSELEEPDGVQLLTRYTPEVLQNEQETALDLVRAVGGHPLALTLMSKYLGSNASMRQPRRLQAALTHLRDAEQRLRLHVPQAPFEHPLTLSPGAEVSIRSVVAVSDNQLPEHARQALRAIAVMPPKPTRLSQQAVLAVAAAPVEDLDLLCDAGLLEQYSLASYYMLHPLIADYVRAQGLVIDASLRLICYGVDFIEMHRSDAAMLERESALLLAALNSAWELEQWELHIRGSMLFVPFLFRWGWYALAEQLLHRSSTAVEQKGMVLDRIRVLEHLSVLAHLQGRYTQAQDSAQQGLALAREIADEEKIVALLTVLGGSTHELGDYAEAEQYYREGLTRARQLGHQEQISTLLKNLGVLAKKRGNYVQAQTYYQEALALARQLDHQDLISLLLMNLGVIATERGDYVLAQMYYQEGLTLARQLGHRERICVLLSNLGVLADAQSDYVQAEVSLSEGLALARELGHRERISLLLLNLGVVANRQGHDREAEDCYVEGLTLARQLGHREHISLLLLNLGDVLMEYGQYAQAHAYFQEGLTLARQLEHRQRISDLLLHLGMLCSRQGDLVQAERYLQEGLTLARQLAHPHLTCLLLAAWGEFHLQQQHTEAAESAFLEMLDLVPVGGRAIVAHAQYGLACVAANTGQYGKARVLASRSYATFESLGHRRTAMVRSLLKQLTS